MDIKKYGMYAALALALLGLVFVSGCSLQSSEENAAALKLAEDKGHAEGLLAAEPILVLKEVEVEVEKELSAEELEAAEALKADAAELAELKVDHSDELAEWARSDEALELCRKHLAKDKDGDVSDALVDALEDAGWDVEDAEEDLLSWKLLDNDELEVESDEDADELEAELVGELKVKFRAEGADGDRHTEYLSVWCEVDEGEVEDLELGLAE